MNKADLVAAMAEKAGVSKKDAEASLKAFTDVVAEERGVLPFCGRYEVCCMEACFVKE